MVSDAILDLALTNGKVTADDVRSLMPNVPYKRSVFGAAFRKLVTEGKLSLVTYQPSQEGQNHGRRIGVYRIPMRRQGGVCP